MKKVLFFAAALILASSCVDEGFDLSEVVTDDMAIGSNESTFKIPLANITVKADAISGEDGSLESILRDADLLIPANFDKLDLQNVPADAFVGELFDNLRNDGGLRRDVGEFLQDSEYREAVVPTLPAELRGLDLAEVFSDHFEVLYARQELRDEMARIIRQYLGSINDTMPSVDVEMDGFGIEENMIDMLTGTGEIRLYGTVANKMPLDGKAVLVLAKNDGSDETIVRLELPLDYTDSSKDFSVTIGNDALRSMTGYMQMHVALDLASYYPRKPLSEADGTVLKLALKLEKKGGLNISDLIDD